MAEYLLLFRDEGSEFPALGEAELEALMGRFIAWAENVSAAGQLKGVERLEGADATVRHRDDAFVLDGPFAEAKETITGYFRVAAQSMDEAAKIAQGCPMLLMGGSVEIRQTAPFPGPTS